PFLPWQGSRFGRKIDACTASACHFAVCPSFQATNCHTAKEAVGRNHTWAENAFNRLPVPCRKNCSCPANACEMREIQRPGGNWQTGGLQLCGVVCRMCPRHFATKLRMRL